MVQLLPFGGLPTWICPRVKPLIENLEVDPLIVRLRS